MCLIHHYHRPGKATYSGNYYCTDSAKVLPVELNEQQLKASYSFLHNTNPYAFNVNAANSYH